MLRRGDPWARLVPQGGAGRAIKVKLNPAMARAALGLPPADVAILADELATADFFDATLAAGGQHSDVHVID